MSNEFVLDLTSVCVRRGALQLPLKMAARLDGERVEARAGGEAYELIFLAPRTLDGFAPFFAAHGLRANDRLKFSLEATDGVVSVTVTFEKRERPRAGSAGGDGRGLARGNERPGRELEVAGANETRARQPWSVEDPTAVKEIRRVRLEASAPPAPLPTAGQEAKRKAIGAAPREGAPARGTAASNASMRWSSLDVTATNDQAAQADPDAWRDVEGNVVRAVRRSRAPQAVDLAATPAEQPVQQGKVPASGERANQQGSQAAARSAKSEAAREYRPLATPPSTNAAAPSTNTTRPGMAGPEANAATTTPTGLGGGELQRPPARTALPRPVPERVHPVLRSNPPGKRQGKADAPRGGGLTVFGLRFGLGRGTSEPVAGPAGSTGAIESSVGPGAQALGQGASGAAAGPTAPQTPEVAARPTPSPLPLPSPSRGAAIQAELIAAEELGEPILVTSRAPSPRANRSAAGTTGPLQARGEVRSAEPAWSGSGWSAAPIGQELEGGADDEGDELRAEWTQRSGRHEERRRDDELRPQPGSNDATWGYGQPATPTATGPAAAFAPPAPIEEDMAAVMTLVTQPGTPAIVKTDSVAAALGFDLQRCERALERLAENRDRVNRIRSGAYMVRQLPQT